MTTNKHAGSTFDSFLEEEGLLENAEEVAIKRVIADNLKGECMTENEIQKFIRIDITNMQKEIQALKDELSKKDEYYMAQIKAILARQQANLLKKYPCNTCNGNGTVYISPVSDCGQSNACPVCNGEGFYWI